MSQAKTAPKSSQFPWALVVIVVAFILSELIFHLVFGDRKHFLDDAKHEPVPGDYFGIIYKGGFIVPFLMTMAIVTFTFGIERFLTIRKAQGSGSLERFLQTIKSKLHSGDINGALAECNKQKGSVANVVQAGLHKYQEMEKNTEFTLEQKVQNIQQEIEEATSLELPGLQKNLPILATIASVATLVALLGTVLGMIRAFAALATTGSPDPAALAAGISEALINTAIGIGTSAFAIIFYNYFTTTIDGLTYGIDEIGYSIAQTFQATKK
ncbi:MAG: MotA/TolQ/ExbB proton channel family protein [Chitinophagales bacterium]|nr:MotA/TolQ/ExbB proton channel family protein [Chitinophagales bacterium]MDW8418938.1 MotA/TolQ/ExbB proton channel family protein [Chitinophagales bacterium]